MTGIHLHSALESDTGVLNDVGALLIGSVLSVAFSGITCYQTICYYDYFPKDGLDLKIWVALISLVDLISTICSSLLSYDFFVKHYGDMYYNGLESILAGSTTILLVQLFFISRIWQLRQVIYFHRKTYNIIGRVVLVRCSGLRAADGPRKALLQTILALYPYVEALVQLTYQNISFISGRPALGTLNMKVLEYSGVLTSTVLDALITASLTHILRQNQHEFTHRKNPFERIMVFFITRGIFIVVYQICTLILPFPTLSKSYKMMPILFCLGKVFAISALMTLNNRCRTRNDDTASGISQSSFDITLPTFRAPPGNHNNSPSHPSRSAVTLQLLSEPSN
ncbi:hypothetical protein FA95DRAFT_1195838 [Auriscalpium vulgare]|uniref:Uncharacterized protein n=1 Tax=Auriscalpium vulgare TaxID=40419 RepID=A0ACB8RUX6_9AGAM|nr:hypothetical protein FA95DRAFT_1195838 [Auriscalpium vulgare]